jgi:hypothetical protein
MLFIDQNQVIPSLGKYVFYSYQFNDWLAARLNKDKFILSITKIYLLKQALTQNFVAFL